MTKEQGRVTSTDVARASGVSRATVSYVLNNDPRQTIPPQTRERVLQAAKQLGYQPFAPARVLRAGYSRLVLVILPFEQVDPKLAGILRDLEAGLAERGFSLILHVGVLNAAPIHPSANLTPAVIAVFAGQAEGELANFLKDFNAPIVWLVNSGYGREEGRLQVEYLFQRGWRHIVFVAPERADIQGLAQHRLDGVVERCAELGLTPPPVQLMPLERERAGVAIRELLVQAAPPFGLCCFNDEVAFAAIAGLTDVGIAIPQMVAVIGCDDIPLAQLSTPALTTVAANQKDREPLLTAWVAGIIAASQGEEVPEYPPGSISVVVRQSA